MANRQTYGFVEFGEYCSNPQLTKLAHGLWTVQNFKFVKSGVAHVPWAESHTLLLVACYIRG